MKRTILLYVILLAVGLSCHRTEPGQCEDDNSIDVITERNFKMGFSTWSFGPELQDREETYGFIAANADIYSEQLDYHIPWKALINDEPFPEEFLNDIDFRLSHRIQSHKLILSVSLLNTSRDDLLDDYDGTLPQYSALNDSVIENAYFKYLEYLIGRFNPDYLIIAMEVNELKIHSQTKWEEYKLLMSAIRSRLRAAYPDLQFSESITLHNWFEPEVDDPGQYISEITDYVNSNLDFVAISFYPFFRNLHTKEDFQRAFDFLHSQTSLPIAFVETNHLAEDLVIESLNVNIPGNVCEQKDYLETLLLNAYSHNYKFVIWWAYRDYDKLWETFPPEIRDIAKIWKDTGLLDGDGNERPAYFVWEEILNR